jgi:hypothetical protein
VLVLYHTAQKGATIVCCPGGPRCSAQPRILGHTYYFDCEATPKNRGTVALNVFEILTYNEVEPLRSRQGVEEETSCTTNAVLHSL